MNAVYGSILENLRAIEIVDKPTVEVFKNDRTNTGDSKELTVSEFISRYLPSTYKVKKGKIYSQTGESNNIDCVVLAPNHPELATPVREIILAEGVYSAIEVKPDISILTEKGEFLRGLNQIKSIKNLERKTESVDLSQLLNKLPKPKYLEKIPAILFSHKSTSIKKTIDYMISKLDTGVLKNDELPDIIVTLDKGIVFYTPCLSHIGIGKSLTEVQRGLYGEEVFIHFETAEKEVTLALFLLLFLNLTPPTILTHDFIIKDYLSKMEVKYTTKFYSVTLTNIQNKLEERLKGKVIKPK